MANLITEKQKSLVYKEYLIRLTTISLLMLSLLGGFVLAYVIPYYISVVKNDLLVSEQFKSVINVENKENVGESVSRIVLRTLDEMRAAELYSTKVLIPSENFAKIINNRNSNIQVNRLSYNLLAPGQGQFLVSGVAKSRDSLVAFIGDLKSKTGFTTVESPVSDFAKDSNIPFTVSIKTNI